MNLDRYGAGCRCLLRIREDRGNPSISDQQFIAEHRRSYADWADRPGLANPTRLIELACEMGIASGGEVFRDYERVLACHRTGNSVLIHTTRESRRAASDALGAEQMGLVIEMSERSLTLWAPASDGSAETQPLERREFWDACEATGIVLYAATPIVAAV